MANTGDKGYRRLEQYDPNTGFATGEIKLNHSSDPNYVPPTYDTDYCPLPVENEPPPNSLSINPTSHFAGYLPESFFIDVVANGNWATSVNVSWINLTITSGGATTSTTIEVFLQKNSTTYMRNGVIDFYMDGEVMASCPVYQEG